MEHIPPRRKAFVETYGCQMNISDGELMNGLLIAHGYQLAATPEDADVILVNTCAVREHAERRVLGRVAQLNHLKRQRPDLLIGVTGCMAQRMGAALLERAPHVELVLGPDGYRSLPETLAALRPVEPDVGGARRLALLDRQPHEDYEGLEAHRTSRVSAWVPVQRGCSFRCTFCIVPDVRGPERNRDPRRILAEVRSIAESGVPEVILLGQTVNSYSHGGWDFPRLLRAVARIDGIRRVRFTAPHPVRVSEELAAVMAEESAVCQQMHLPLQAGHDRTLRRMGRRYTVAGFLEKVEMLRSVVPGISLSTDIIVAFPGETAEEFEATLELLRRVRFDDAFLYKYSPRAGTPASRLPERQFVAPDAAQDRLQRVIEVQRAIQAEIAVSELGRDVDVLVERPARSVGDMLGRTGSNKVVAFPGTAELIGRFVVVRLKATSGATFTGEIVKPPVPTEESA